MCALGWYVHTHRAPEPERQDQGANTRYSVESGCENEACYWAAVPALPGVVVQGQSKDEAKARVTVMALRALADRLESQQTKVHSFCFHVGS